MFRLLMTVDVSRAPFFTRTSMNERPSPIDSDGEGCPGQQLQFMLSSPRTVGSFALVPAAQEVDHTDSRDDADCDEWPPADIAP
jgi:hypothetical protein